MSPTDETSPPDRAPDPAPTSGELRSLRLRVAVRRLIRWGAAVVLTVTALLLAAVPGVPGVPLFIVALILVAPDVPLARRLAAKVQRRIPKFRRAIPRSWRRPKGGPR